MYVFRENSLVPIALKHIVLTGEVEDFRIKQIEQIIANEYNVSVHELDVYYRDSEAKIMCCFMVHNLLGYSVKSIAKKYKIYPAFLQNKINEHFIKCLEDKVFFNQITRLRDAFLFKGNLLHTKTIINQ